MSDIQNQQQPLADALTDALAEIERLRAEVARLEAVVALQRGSMQPHRDEYEMTQFQWNQPPSGPGHETPAKESEP